MMSFFIRHLLKAVASSKPFAASVGRYHLTRGSSGKQRDWHAVLRSRQHYLLSQRGQKVCGRDSESAGVHRTVLNRVLRTVSARKQSNSVEQFESAPFTTKCLFSADSREFS